MASNKASLTFSAVVPVYGCANCLLLLCEKLRDNLLKITPHFEIILVDDRSPDGAWEVIQLLQDEIPQVKGVRLSRNFGQQIAISAGLAQARGDYVVVLDCDLQDPPERIFDLYLKIQGGFDAVLARRVERNHSWFRQYAGKIYFHLMSLLTEKSIDGSYGTFSLLSRKVVDAFLRFGERERHYLFILNWLGFKLGSIDYVHEVRTIGKSSYSLSRLVRHALDGLLFQSVVLLRWIVSLGFIFAFCGILLAAFYVYRFLAHGSLEGWTTVVVLILVSTGTILLSIGVAGLYIGKIFDQTKGRPLYVVDVILEQKALW